MLAVRTCVHSQSFLFLHVMQIKISCVDASGVGGGVVG